LELCSPLAGRILEVATREPLRLRAALMAIPGIEDARPFGDRLHVRTQNMSTAPVITAIEKLSGHPSVLEILPSLEDVFLSLTSQAGIENG
jgi:hypothetical protein